MVGGTVRCADSYRLRVSVCGSSLERAVEVGRGAMRYSHLGRLAVSTDSMRTVLLRPQKVDGHGTDMEWNLGVSRRAFVRRRQAELPKLDALPKSDDWTTMSPGGDSTYSMRAYLGQPLNHIVRHNIRTR